MHFSDNQDPRAKTDRIWRIRPLVNALEDTFKRGYIPGPCLSFDEGMLPSRSKFNKTRMYLKDKPHKWGTKMFLTCCAKTSYCLRFEIYCGKKGGDITDDVDHKAGPAAVLRNIEKVLPTERTHKYLIGMDRFYNSVQLFVELLAQGVYGVGTIQTRRIGFPSALKESRKKRPKTVPRGSYKIARCSAVPNLLACCWWDNKPVHLIATGASSQQLSIVRRSGAVEEEIPCPKLVMDYQKNMGGVDVFDQLRLQRYSVQLAHRFKKYYKSLALGLLDCALVNAFIVHREHNSRLGKSGLEHGEFLMVLQRHLVQFTQANFMDARAETDVDEGYRVLRSIDTNNHDMSLTDDFIEATPTQPRKRMTRACKVCSILAHGDQRAAHTSISCALCSRNFRGDVYLCSKARHSELGATKTCFQIWHQDWQGGKNLPPGAEKRIRFRPPTGKKTKDTRSKRTSIGSQLLYDPPSATR